MSEERMLPTSCVHSRIRHVPLQRIINRADERAVARILPAWPHVVGHIGECDACIGIAETQRSARSEMTEGSWIGTDGPLGLRQLKSDSETAWSLIDQIEAIRLFGGRGIDHRARNDAYAVDLAAIGERCINTRHAARRAMSIGRGDFRHAPLRRIHISAARYPGRIPNRRSSASRHCLRACPAAMS